jgi:hypothetical protein
VHAVLPGLDSTSSNNDLEPREVRYYAVGDFITTEELASTVVRIIQQWVSSNTNIKEREIYTEFDVMNPNVRSNRLLLSPLTSFH